MKLGDLNWRLAPLVSFLNAFGGWAFKLVRRLGIPVSVTIFAYLYSKDRKRDSIFFPIIFLSSFAAFTLPLTLVGDSIPGHWINWLWVWGLGAVQGISLFPLCFLKTFYQFEDHVMKWLFGVIICTLVSGVVFTLSNLIGFPVHAWCEALVGLAYGGVAAWLLD